MSRVAVVSRDDLDRVVGSVDLTDALLTVQGYGPEVLGSGERAVRCERERCGRVMLAYRDRTTCPACGAFTVAVSSCDS